MLHICNTLQKRKYLENGTLWTLLTFTIVFYEWFYTQNVYRYVAKRSATYWTRWCPKSGFVVLLLSPFAHITRYCGNFIPFFWYQPVPLTVPQLNDTVVLSLVHRLSSKTTKTKSPYTLYRQPLAAGQHHTVPPGNRGELTYRPLPSYTKHFVTAVF